MEACLFWFWRYDIHLVANFEAQNGSGTNSVGFIGSVCSWIPLRQLLHYLGFLVPKAEERAKKLAAKKARDFSVMYESQMGIMRPNLGWIGNIPSSWSRWFPEISKRQESSVFLDMDPCPSELVSKTQFGRSTEGFWYVKKQQAPFIGPKNLALSQVMVPKKKRVKNSGSGQLGGCPKLRANLIWKEVGEPSDHLMPRSRFREASWRGFWGGFLDQQNTYSIASKWIFIYQNLSFLHSKAEVSCTLPSLKLHGIWKNTLFLLG